MAETHPMTLAELNDRALKLREQILQLNAEMDRIHDEKKIVAHSRRILKLQNDLEDVMADIHRQN